MRAVLRKKDTTQNYVFLKYVPQLATGWLFTTTELTMLQAGKLNLVAPGEKRKRQLPQFSSVIE